MSRYNHYDTKLAPGVYVDFETVVEPDPDCDPHDFDCYTSDDLDAFDTGAREFVGISVIATVHIVGRYGGATTYRVQSAGVWGVDGDDDYRRAIARDQQAELLADLKLFASATLRTPVR